MIDDHNGLCEHKTSKYLGLSSNPKAVVHYGFFFFTEVANFKRVVYWFSDCPAIIGMDKQLRHDSAKLAGMSMKYGFPICLESVWQSIKSFGLPSKHNPPVLDPWHHCDSSSKWFLILFWDYY